MKGGLGHPVSAGISKAARSAAFPALNAAAAPSSGEIHVPMGRRTSRASESPAGGGTGWLLTYGDMMSLLVVFFVLLFTLSSPGPGEEVVTAQPEAPLRAVLGGAPWTRLGSFPRRWTLVGRVEFVPNSLSLSPAGREVLEEDLRPFSALGAGRLVLLGVAGSLETAGSAGWETLHRGRALAEAARSALQAFGADPSKLHVLSWAGTPETLPTSWAAGGLQSRPARDASAPCVLVFSAVSAE